MIETTTTEIIMIMIIKRIKIIMIVITMIKISYMLFRSYLMEARISILNLLKVKSLLVRKTLKEIMEKTLT